MTTRDLFSQPRDNTGIFKIGTSGWSYPPGSGPGTWTGIFYPVGKTDELKFYSRYFNTVEINSTFYRPCDPRMSSRWVERTPPEFEFTVKVWQRLTHDREPWTGRDVDLFLPGLGPLEDSGKLGCLLFQFPASFHRDSENEDRLTNLLARFAPRPMAVELRHRSWSGSGSFLEEHGAVPVFIDEPKFRTSIRQSLVPFGKLLYLRLHGKLAGKWWVHETRDERYDYFYSRPELEPYAERLRQISDDGGAGKVYVFFNNHPNAKAVANAVMLRKLLGMPVTTEIPQTLVRRYPEMERQQ